MIQVWVGFGWAEGEAIEKIIKSVGFRNKIMFKLLT